MKSIRVNYKLPPWMKKIINITLGTIGLILLVGIVLGKTFYCLPFTFTPSSQVPAICLMK